MHSLYDNLDSCTKLHGTDKCVGVKYGNECGVSRHAVHKCNLTLSRLIRTKSEKRL